MKKTGTIAGADLYFSTPDTLAGATEFPPAPFRLVPVLSAEEAAAEDAVVAFARRALAAGAVAVHCAGGGARAVEETFNEQIGKLGGDASGRVVTTEHEDEPLEEALYMLTIGEDSSRPAVVVALSADSQRAAFEALLARADDALREHEARG